MKAYIYNVDTMEVRAVINGDTNEAIEEAADIFTATDNYALTYTPAFGMEGGLIDDPTADEITV